MQRARRSLLSVVVLAVALIGIAGVTPNPVRLVSPAAAVSWPVSAGLVVSEVVTGGASASDEYVELFNAGAASLDLQDVELVYVSSAGTTPTRKASWSASRPLAPGQHLLVANTSGVFAGSADATWSSGIAANGGAVALRVIGGAVIDAVGWGDATNAFVEGSPASAPAASAAIERRPGGAAGNGTDTNANAADFVVQAHPVPQNLASAPTLPPASPSPTASPAPLPSVTPAPAEVPTEAPTATPGPTDEPGDSPTPRPVPTDEPMPSPTVTPSEPEITEPPVTATSEPVPTDPPTASPSPSPTDPPAATDPPATEPPVTQPPATAALTPAPSSPLPTPAAITILEARILPDDQATTIEGVLTTDLGAMDGGRGAFVEDETAGIGLYLDGTPSEPLLRGTRIRVSGVLDQRYAQRVVRVARPDIVDLGTAVLPLAAIVSTGEAGEAFEGSRVSIQGTLIGSASSVTDGVSLTVDDGSGQVRVIVAVTPAGLAPGCIVRAVGPLGQRDSSGTGTSGYRVYALGPADVDVSLPATPSPSASATPPVSPSPSATGPSASPSPSGPAVISIASARAAAVGTRVHVRGVVTAEAGRVGANLVAIQDETGGLAVHLPSGAVAPARGAVMDVTGDLAEPYGQLEVRPTAAAWRLDGAGDLPAAVVLAGSLDETLEGLLVAITGTVAAGPTGDGDISFDVDLAAGARIRVVADATSAIAASTLHRGSRYRLTGVAGQRATATGRLDGYRIWLRDTDDVIALPEPAPSPSPSPTTGATPKPTATPGPSARPTKTPGPSPTGPAVITIAAAIVSGGTVAVEGIVTAGSGLLDRSGRTVVIQDGSAAIQVRLPAGQTAKVGRLLRVAGDSGRSYGAPRILARTVTDLGAATAPAPVVLHGLPTAAVEWRLVRIVGTVATVRRSGRAWKAEIAGDGVRYLVDGLEAAGIPADRLRVGGRATITGVARRPRPTATERRFTILPRTLADVVVSGGSTASSGADASGPTPKPAKVTTATGTGGSGGTGRTLPPGTGGGTEIAGADGPLDVDLADLPASTGRSVRVGGLITATAEDGVSLDDGTAVARATFTGDALALLPQLSVGLALNLIGTAGAGPVPRLTVASQEGVVPISAPVASGADGAADASGAPGATAEAVATADSFGLSGVAEPGATQEPGEAGGGSGILVVGMLLSLALVGVVALLLRRRPEWRPMARPNGAARR
jgi:hypothetical protein